MADPVYVPSGEEVAIQTAQITVKTLTIGKRGVTLSLFRQLPHEGLILVAGPDGPAPKLAGVPWGRVRVDSKFDEIHIVWQKGPNLLRSLIRYSPSEIRPISMRSGGEPDFPPFQAYYTRFRETAHPHMDHHGDLRRAVPELDTLRTVWAQHLAVYRALYDQLAALDQLFIAT